MYYPDELVEDVRQKNDIVDVISGYVSLQKKGSNYMCCCPFHGEKTPSFSVNRAKIHCRRQFCISNFQFDLVFAHNYEGY